MIIDFVMYLNYIMRNKKSIKNNWFLYTENMQIASIQVITNAYELFEFIYRS